MKKMLCPTLCLALLLSACTGNKPAKTETNADSAAIAERPAVTAKIAGIYVGTIPGADAKSNLDLMLTLKADTTWEMLRHYPEEKAEISDAVTTGKIEIKGDTLHLLGAEDMNTYLIGQDKLQMLSGNELPSDPSMYQLLRHQSPDERVSK